MKEYDRELLGAMANFGYPLFEPNVRPDPNLLLPRLVKTRELRLLEGFPVVLSHVLSRPELRFDMAKAGENLTPSDRRLFRGLYQVSCQLFMLYGLEFPNLKRKDMPKDAPQVEKFKSALVNDEPFDLEGLKLDSKRLKQTFLRYVVRKGAELGAPNEEKSRLRDELRQEFLLSLLLTPLAKRASQQEACGKRLHENGAGILLASGQEEAPGPGRPRPASPCSESPPVLKNGFRIELLTDRDEMGLAHFREGVRGALFMGFPQALPAKLINILSLSFRRASP